MQRIIEAGRGFCWLDYRQNYYGIKVIFIYNRLNCEKGFHTDSGFLPAYSTSYKLKKSLFSLYEMISGLEFGVQQLIVFNYIKGGKD